MNTDCHKMKPFQMNGMDCIHLINTYYNQRTLYFIKTQTDIIITYFISVVYIIILTNSSYLISINIEEYRTL